jgi:deoxyribose-phosphate aldolase
MLGASELAKFFDHTLLSPVARESQIVELCNQAREYGFFAVCVQPYWVSRCQGLLKNSGVKICTVVGFPLGQNTLLTKLFETESALASGAQEIDMVINLSAFKDQRFHEVETEIAQVVKICGSNLTKVIIETSFLSPLEIQQATLLCENAGATFVKTSTGFSSRGASLEDIQIMRTAITSNLKIKASGGIQNLETTLKFIAAGAHRIGSSKSVQILNELTGDQK